MPQETGAGERIINGNMKTIEKTQRAIATSTDIQVKRFNFFNSFNEESKEQGSLIRSHSSESGEDQEKNLKRSREQIARCELEDYLLARYDQASQGRASMSIDAVDCIP